MPAESFQGLRVLSFESRRSTELQALVTKFGGRPVSAPALREVTLEANDAALAFLGAVGRHEFDLVIFLTGVGTRVLLQMADGLSDRERVLAGLAETKVVARGPKPAAVLREWRIPIWATAPEPNTWREVLDVLDARARDIPLEGARIAIQEYGTSSVELIAALSLRRASVRPVPVYQWALPHDTAPVERAIGMIATGAVDIVFFTTRVQVDHVWEIAGRSNQIASLERGLRRLVIASIGPTTSESLRRRGIEPDLEPSHPKMGVLVTETAAKGPALLAAKRADQ